jgi:sRNA-binding protein
MMSAMFRRAKPGGTLGVLVASVLAGCGPVAYIGQVTLTADDAVVAARRAHADKYSPYWYTRATQYLHMAREVAGHSDFQGANKFGRLAAEAAVKAQEEAAIGAQDPSKLPYSNLHLDDDKAPAKDDTTAPAKAPKPIAPAKDPKAIAPAKDDK